MSFTYLNAEAAIRVATSIREVIAKEGAESQSPSYNQCTLFVRPTDLDLIAERLGAEKKTFNSDTGQTIQTVYWNDTPGAYITFQAVI